MALNHSASNEIIIDYLFKVSKSNVKTMFSCDINRSILSDKLSKVIHLSFIGYFICLLKDAVMQIERALINDRLHVSKVS